MPNSRSAGIKPSRSLACPTCCPHSLGPAARLHFGRSPPGHRCPARTPSCGFGTAPATDTELLAKLGLEGQRPARSVWERAQLCARRRRRRCEDRSLSARTHGRGPPPASLRPRPVILGSTLPAPDAHACAVRGTLVRWLATLCGTHSGKRQRSVSSAAQYVCSRMDGLAYHDVAPCSMRVTISELYLPRLVGLAHALDQRVRGRRERAPSARPRTTSVRSACRRGRWGREVIADTVSARAEVYCTRLPIMPVE